MLNKCLLCGNTFFQELWHVDKLPLLFGAVPLELKGKVNSYPLTIASCKKCFLIQQINLLSESVLDQVYEAEYYSCPSPAINNMGRGVLEEFHSFFISCCRHISSGETKNKLLEIGCFDGYLLMKLKDEWDVYGCDPSGATRNIAIKNLGAEKVKNTFFSKDDYPLEYFDAIIFRNVLEHLYDPHNFLDAINRSLKSSGNVFIEVPNVYFILDSGGFGSFFHQHISYFSLHTLRLLLANHGFVIENYKESSTLYIRARKQKEDLSAGMDIVADVDNKYMFFLKRSRIIRQKIIDIFSGSFNSIAIFSASAMATSIINMLTAKEIKKIKFIFDNDTAKQGKTVDQAEVLITSPQELNHASFDAILITSPLFYNEIYEQLIKLGVDKAKIIANIFDKYDF